MDEDKLKKILEQIPLDELEDIDDEFEEEISEEIFEEETLEEVSEETSTQQEEINQEENNEKNQKEQSEEQNKDSEKSQEKENDNQNQNEEKKDDSKQSENEDSEVNKEQNQNNNSNQNQNSDKGTNANQNQNSDKDTNANQNQNKDTNANQNQNKNTNTNKNQNSNSDQNKKQNNAKNTNQNKNANQKNKANRPPKQPAKPRGANAGAGANKPKTNKLNSAVNTARNKMQAAKQNKEAAPQNKPGPAKQAANAAKEKAKSAVKNKIKAYIMKNPIVLFYIILAVLALFLIALIIIAIIGAGGQGGGGEVDGDTSYYIDPAYDYTTVQVNINNGYFEETVDFTDYIKGLTYVDFYEQYGESLTESIDEDVLAAYMVTIKHDIFTIGQYSISTKSSGLNLSNEFDYCNIHKGCRVFEENGQKKYVTYYDDDTNTYPADAIIIPPAEEDFYDALDTAYYITSYEILAPKTLNEELTDYTQLIHSGDGPQLFIDSFIATWTSGRNDYYGIIEEEQSFKKYYVYDIRNFVTYQTGGDVSYYWPVDVDENGNVETTTISSQFNFTSGNYGIKITKADTSSGINVVAIADGIISCVSRTDPVTYAELYKVTINHTISGNPTGLISEYDNLAGCPVSGSTVEVRQGQKLMSTFPGMELDFKIRIEDFYINPLDYVDPSNPRPTSASDLSISYSEGSSNKQSICLSLQESGFSVNATAALLSNIKHESGFRPNVDGDDGTSYGLCQWHESRKTDLQRYCDDDYSTIACQLDFLVYELKNKYKSVYRSLTSNNSTYQMAFDFCYTFEVPANKEVKCVDRGNKATSEMLPYVQNGCED